MAETGTHPSGFPAHLVAFVTTVNGAISMTMSTLSAYRRPHADPDDFPRDDRADLPEMERLCRDLGVDNSGLQCFNQLLDLQDKFVAQGRQVSPEQTATAEGLAREYIDWMFATFPERIKQAP